jgi:PKD repeat protein
MVIQMTHISRMIGHVRRIIMKTLIKVLTTITVLSIICIGLVFLTNQNTSQSIMNTSIESPNKTIDAIIPADQISHYQMGSGGLITIHATEPETPESLPLYRGVFHDGDYVDKSFEKVFKDRSNVTSEQDAPSIAIIALEPYGGLPPDAEMSLVETNHYELIKPITHEVVERTPIYTDVFYHRVVDGMPVLGFSDKIQVTLGEDGKVLELLKIWRTLEYTGRNISIISARTATDKLLNGEVLDPPMGMDDVQIYTIKLVYYEKSRTEPELFLEPVWAFQGNKTSGIPEEFLVYARQFANFTATPTSGKTPLSVNFTDTSDASPKQWYWYFGDGTNSTDQNPVHIYTTAGTYNVTLRAWNDLGSDTIEKAGYITVRDPAAPVANFTGTPATGSAPLSVTFNDTSINAPTGWLWSFGDGTNATEQNPVHMYSTPGNYTVSLNVTNEDGTNSITKPDYITVSNLPPTTITTQPTTTVTTTITTTVTTATTTPTPTKTHAPLSPVVPVAGILIIGMFAVLRRKKDR